MGFYPTVIAVVVSFGFALFCNIMARRPYKPGSLPLLPYMMLQIVSFIVGVVFAIHLFFLTTA